MLRISLESVKRSRDFHSSVQMAESSSGLATEKNLSWVSMGFGQKAAWNDAGLKYPALYFSHMSSFFFPPKHEHCVVETASKPQEGVGTMSSQHPLNDTPFTL